MPRSLTLTYLLGCPLKAVEQADTMGAGSVGWRKGRWKEKRNQRVEEAGKGRRKPFCLPKIQ